MFDAIMSRARNSLSWVSLCRVCISLAIIFLRTAYMPVTLVAAHNLHNPYNCHSNKPADYVLIGILNLGG